MRRETKKRVKERKRGKFRKLCPFFGGRARTVEKLVFGLEFGAHVVQLQGEQLDLLVSR